MVTTTSTNHRIRRVDPQGSITTLAGDGYARFGGDGGPATLASLDIPAAVAVADIGNIYVADPDNHRIRQVAGRLRQFIAFGEVPPLAVKGTGVLSASASSDLAVTFTSKTPSVCTVSGTTVTGVAVGTCTIAANQAGNNSYESAPQVLRSAQVFDASSCSGTTLTIQDKRFDAATTLCTGSTSITTSGTVEVQSGATLKLFAPSIRLEPGFRAHAGSGLEARQAP